MPSNDQLINDPEQTMKLIAEGIGHFARLVCAAMVSREPGRAERIAQLLQDSGEAMVITAVLRAGVLHTSVGLQTRDSLAPIVVAERADALQPIMGPCTH